MRVASPVVLSPAQRVILEAQARARRASARSVERARVVLLAAAGLQNQDIAAQLQIMPETVARWRRRFLTGGVEALAQDAPRPGRPRTITDAEVRKVVRKTTQQTPPNATHWSTRTMAAATGISERSVRRIWRQHGLKPHLVRTFRDQSGPGLCREARGDRRVVPRAARTCARPVRRARRPRFRRSTDSARPAAQARPLRHADP